ncbi:MAG: DUF389 domain-containing protein [Bdellovibrionales bacterium]|nr:DUF389 domain-containing protein [Bdellovibrionales bacterium]
MTDLRTIAKLPSKPLHAIKNLFKLQDDTDEEGTVDSIRKNAEFRSANAWTLFFAIIIASVGLNTNSAAVIIGAMLISPLMGPIVGIGLALGIYDFQLLKEASKNLLVGVGISIVASSLYFALSPLSAAQSELLARTHPTVFDVLIAVFGGAAGIVASSRKERGNAIPGVAIATALMPPLCTAGYGLASRQWEFFFGALYLFVINSVFICLSTYFFVRLLKFRPIAYVEEVRRRRLKKVISIIAVCTFLPSVVLAWIFVTEEVMRSKALSFIGQEINFNGAHVIRQKINPSLRNPTIEVELIGSKISAQDEAVLESKLSSYGLSHVTLKLKQSSFEADVERRISESLGSKMVTEEQSNTDHQKSIEILSAQLAKIQDQGKLAHQLLGEISVFVPDISEFYLTYLYDGADAINASQPGERGSAPQVSTGQPKHVAIVKFSKRPTKATFSKIEALIRARLVSQDLTLMELR